MKTVFAIMSILMIALLVSLARHRQGWHKEARIAALKDAQSTAHWAAKSIGPLVRDGGSAEIIRESLASEFTNNRIVLAACVFAADGNILANYVRVGFSMRFPQVHGLSVVPLDGKQLDMFYPLTEGDRQLGTLFLRLATWEHVTVKGENILAAPIVERDYEQ